jgi:polar amino acid transport system substrate-binding protein
MQVHHQVSPRRLQVRRRLIGLVMVLWAALFAVPAYSLDVYCEEDPPFQFRDANGQLTGLTVDIVTDIQRRVGNSDPIQVVPWARGLLYLDNEPDTLLFSMSRTAERKADSKVVIKSLADAKRTGPIGVYRGDVREAFLLKNGFTNLDRTTDNLSNFKKLMAGRFVLYAGASNGIASEAERAGFNLKDVKLVYEFLKTQDFIAASKQTDPKIVAQWNAALDSMKKDGTFQALFSKYLPGHPLPGPAITRF